MAFHDRLRLARLRAGLTMAGLGEKIDLTPQAINKYEKGEMMPSSSVLVSLAKSLDVTLDFLMSNQVVALEGVEFRKRASTSEREKAFIEAEVIDHVERYLAVEEILDLPDSGSELDQIEQVTVSNLNEVEILADALRKKWNIGGDPIPSMTSLLEERNIRVLEIEGTEKFFGLTCRVRRSSNRPSIPVVVRRHVNIERDRFTMAHELGHAVISDYVGGKSEKAMDRFAAAFLIPAEHLKKEIGPKRNSLGYNELIQIKHIYGVSLMALLYRLKDIGVISEESLRNLFRGPAREWMKSEPKPLSEDGDIATLEKPRRFESHVYRAMAEKLISSVKASALLRKPVHEVEDAVNGPRHN